MWRVSDCGISSGVPSLCINCSDPCAQRNCDAANPFFASTCKEGDIDAASGSFSSASGDVGSFPLLSSSLRLLSFQLVPIAVDSGSGESDNDLGAVKVAHVRVNATARTSAVVDVTLSEAGLVRCGVFLTGDFYQNISDPKSSITESDGNNTVATALSSDTQQLLAIASQGVSGYAYNDHEIEIYNNNSAKSTVQLRFDGLRASSTYVLQCTATTAAAAGVTADSMFVYSFAFHSPCCRHIYVGLTSVLLH